MKRLIVTAITALALGAGSTYAATSLHLSVQIGHKKSEPTQCQEAVPGDSWWEEDVDKWGPTCPDWRAGGYGR